MNFAVRSLLFASFAAAAVAQEPIKVGEYASITGKESSLGTSSHQGTVLAFEEINAAGGVLGRPIELIAEDTQSKAGESATAVKKLISRDKVVAVLGEVASSRSLEAAPICQGAKIPMITPASTNEKVTEVGSYIFRICYVDSFQGPVMAKFAKDSLHAKRIAVISSVSSAYSVGLAKYFKEPFVAGGGEVVAEPKYSEGDKDFYAQLTAIKAAGVDAIFNPGYYNEGALIMKQARGLGLTMPVFGADSWDAQQLIDLAGPAAEGCYFCSHYSPADTSPIVQKFVAAYKKRFPPSALDSNCSLAYDSAYVLADAIRRAGTTDHVKLRDAIATTTNFPAVTGNITIDAKRNASKPATIIQVHDGHFRYFETIGP